MSDLTALDAVKKAAERAMERIKAQIPNRPTEYDQSLIGAGYALEAFIQELEAAMRNPREKTDGG